ncbi:ABC transporter ATP-binding protein [Lusitaniella coriacea LEGE 07157]|uniref:ABC transporter ATP-binding protein n=1 Tax=Lusitaniella coriacea LEGE 07157 TaxID=945747 RepID=A0A8J7J1Q0_9CYAN|nr:ABC transporter ATP-binding protein [Lusitaniella coriacea LEGE 07157]
MTKLEEQARWVKTGGAIAASGVWFSYPNRPAILQDLSFSILPRERVGLIGSNGAGKTTLFLTICGLLSPTGGTLTLLGKPIIKGEFRPEIGLVFQNPDDQLFCASVRDDVAFGAENLGLDPEEVDRRVHQALSATGVLPLIDRVPHQLSGGEKCMVAIASVLVMHPKVMLYDEPSANLDLRARRRLIRFLQQSQQTLAIASHDLEMILEVCDRVLLLDRGQVVADGKPQTIMSDRTLMETNGLEVPLSLT